MTVRERILAIKLLEAQERDSEFTERIGIQVKLQHKDLTEKEEGHA